MKCWIKEKFMNIEIKMKDKLKVEAVIRDHVVKADQDKGSGGDNSGPNPFEYFAASIGMCASYYIKAFCRERNIDISDIEIIEKVSREEKGDKVKFSINVKLPADFPEKYKNALIKVASECTVKKAIQAGPEFEINLS
ncbi:MAG: OsmC family protein [Pseudomonadota bacterium]